MLTQDQLEALIAAGGCAHTPDPFVACDTCSRPAKPGRPVQALLYDFQAVDVDGKVYDKRDVLSVANLPLDKIARITFMCDDRRVPHVMVECDPRRGERIHQFTRHAVRLATAGPATGKLSVAVIEIRYDPADEKRFVRLYLHPMLGPILSTRDLYF